jgi:tRNA pseudouridine-54 N-methylase
MREFIYYSERARTSGNFGDDLMKAGRMDIVCNVIIQAFFLSNKTREDLHLHLIFNGPPNSPMHLEIISNPELPISKKDVAGLIKRMLYKCKEGKKTEVFPGCFIEKKSLNHLIKEIEENGKKVLILDSSGKKLRELTNSELEGSVFLIGDQEGLPKEILKRNKENFISIGKVVYFASQTFIIINHEIDLRKE